MDKRDHILKNWTKSNYVLSLDMNCSEEWVKKLRKEVREENGLDDCRKRNGRFRR